MFAIGIILQDDVTSYRQSQDVRETEIFFQENEIITEQFHGTLANLLQGTPRIIFDVVTWNGELPTRSRLPFGGTPGEHYARAVGDMPWINGTCKLW